MTTKGKLTTKRFCKGTMRDTYQTRNSKESCFKYGKRVVPTKGTRRATRR